MERGLLWLPLLAIFTWLAWQGRNEFQKVEAYEKWAKQFERSKYDIYAVLAQKGSDLIWGKPTPKGIIDLKTFSLKNVRSLHVVVDEKPVSLETPPSKGRAIALEFIFADSETVRVPFTDISIAVDWAKYLQQELQKQNV
ncbi:MAG TPA: hypothetical protein DEV81_21030 [Cyanobacteria bacterium UBA11049]|nr:hypothetical protein [Cyanobacteria bacterium UBA11049]